MARPPKRDTIPRVLRQPSNGIAGYEQRSLEEQIKLFADLVQTSGGTAVQKLWPKLDRDARGWVMQQLGCFAGPVSPQYHYLPRFEESRAVVAEMSLQIRTLEKSIVAVESFVAKLEVWNVELAEYRRLS